MVVVFCCVVTFGLFVWLCVCLCCFLRVVLFFVVLCVVVLFGLFVLCKFACVADGELIVVCCCLFVVVRLLCFVC